MKDKEIVQKEIIQIHPGLIVLREHEKGNIYPQGIIRIMVKDNFIKITGNYGFSIAADTEKAQKSIDVLGWNCNFSYEKMADEFRVRNGEIRMFADPDIEKLLRDITNSIDDPEDLVLRLKVMEVIICIWSKGADEGQRLPISDDCSPSQAVLARSAYSYMMVHMNQLVTIDELSRVFGVSATQIKVSFKLYYGESVHSFMRREKIHVAAGMLRETDSSVMQIAGECGYSSASKFSKVFFEIMAVTPREYRSQA